MTRNKQTEPEHAFLEDKKVVREPGKMWKRPSQRGSEGREQKRAISENGDFAGGNSESPTARFSSWLSRWNSSGSGNAAGGASGDGQRNLKEESDGGGHDERAGTGGRRNSVSDTFKELENQGRVLFDDDSEESTESSATSEEEGGEEEEKEDEVEGDREGDGEQEGDALLGGEGRRVEKFQAGGMGGVVGVTP